MHYLPLDAAMQAIFTQHLPLSPAQAGRIAQLCAAVLLAGHVHLTRVARFLNRTGNQDSQVRWIQRLLQAPFLTWESVYWPLVTHALAGMHPPVWHLILDRTHMEGTHEDLVTIALSYHGRAIPLLWQRVPFGGADAETYCHLLRRLWRRFPLLRQQQVVLHGDTEFGNWPILRLVREFGWDYCLAFASNTHFRYSPYDQQSQPLSTLPVTRQHSVGLSNIALFATQGVSGLNVLAFYAKRMNGVTVKREVIYLVTSLPLSSSLRRIGARRWGIEPFHRDLKSSGWQVTLSQVGEARFDALLVILAATYLWAVCIGRWLCKTGQRARVDAKPTRHLSLFRIGWDWLIHSLRINQPVPTLFILYT
jgi:hypothetical protein